MITRKVLYRDYGVSWPVDSLVELLMMTKYSSAVAQREQTEIQRVTRQRKGG